MKDSARKAALRRTHLDLVAGITPAARRALASMVMARLESLDEYAAASTILFYWPVPALGEIDFACTIRAALGEGKAVCLPRVNWKTGLMTARRIRSLTRDVEIDRARPELKLRQPVAAATPIPADRIDLILVPGVAFDSAGRRLGRGGGFYDRFLADLPGDRPIRVALAFDEQLARRIPTAAHDEPVHIVLTPTATLRAKTASRRLARRAASSRNTRQASSPTRARPKR